LLLRKILPAQYGRAFDSSVADAPRIPQELRSKKQFAKGRDFSVGTEACLRCIHGPKHAVRLIQNGANLSQQLHAILPQLAFSRFEYDDSSKQKCREHPAQRRDKCRSQRQNHALLECAHHFLLSARNARRTNLGQAAR
jgi:hypothetical protein